MNFLEPLEMLQTSLDKTPQYWFEQYAVWLNNKNNNVSTINKQNGEEMSCKLVCFRGMISDQLNPEYFCSQFITDNHNKDGKIYSGLYCDSTNVPKNETILFNNEKTKTLQRYPMVLLNPPNQTKWHKHKDSQESPQKLIAKFYTCQTSLKICDLVDVYGIWYPSNQANESASEQKDKENENVCIFLSYFLLFFLILYFFFACFY